MQTHLRQVIDDVWKHHRLALSNALGESIRELANVLRLDDYHRDGHKKENLEKSMGSFGSSSLDLSALSDVLSNRSGSRIMPDERRERVGQLKATLEESLKVISGEMESLPAADFSESEASIHEKAETHLNQIANVFRLLRIAQLEVRSKYHAPSHDPLFAEFTWRNLSPGELSQCPPFVVFAQLEEDCGSQLRKMMGILESRKPVKIAATRASLRKIYSPTADPSLPASLSLETIPMAMRGICFLQTCPAIDGFKERLFKALSSPRPGIISYLAHHPGENDDAYRHRAKQAVHSRAFPSVLYDPDFAPEFVACFDLTGNPSPELPWFKLVDASQSDSQKDVLYTFADFAVHQAEFKSDFSEPGSDIASDSLIPLIEYIHMSRRQRIAKQPMVKIAGIGQAPRPLVASQGIVTQVCDQMHLWKTLQELAGINNPYVQKTRKVLHDEFGVQQKALLESLQEEMEKQQSGREQAAVASAVRNIVANLTGVDPGSIKLN